MKRLALVASGVATMVALVGAPALAKGPLVPISGKVVISGPGLDRAVILRGKVYWYDYWADGSKAPTNQITVVLRQLGLLDAGPEVGWYVPPVSQKTLGPGYEVQEYLDLDGKGLQPATTATVFPFAPERPLVVPSKGLGWQMGQWWSAPPALRTWLVSRGVPVASLVAATPASKTEVQVAGHRSGSGAAVLFASASLLAMVVLAALAGRRPARIG